MGKRGRAEEKEGGRCMATRVSEEGYEQCEYLVGDKTETRGDRGKQKGIKSRVFRESHERDCRK